MDYKEKYEKSIEALRGFIEGCEEDNQPILKEDLIEIFPELKENEDERIRKTLIKGFKKLESDYEENVGEDCIWSELKVKDVIAWLEKQKFENNVSEEVDSQAWQIANNAAITWEQSMAILMAADKAFKKGKAEGLKEQKSIEWGEEDEMYLRLAIGSVYSTKNIVNGKDDVVEWLKSLKRRMEEQQ